YRPGDFVAGVKAITDGSGVDVVYDSVGKDTFPGSLDCLKPSGPRGSFGQSSGRAPAVEKALLQSKGSLLGAGPTNGQYLAKRAELEAAADSLFSVLKAGTVKIEIGQEFALKDAGEAHRALEERRTTGATVLVV